MIRTSSFSQKRFQKLESFRKPLLKQSSLPMLLTDQAAIKIQRFYRGYRGRKLFRDRSVFSFRQRYQKQFETLEGLQRFKFQQFGAAIVIQRWFRSWKSVRKSIWHKKHHLMKLKYMHHKVLLRAIFKSRSIPFTQPDLDNTTKLRHAAAIVAQRVIRGFLGRRRFKAYKLHVADTKMLRNRTAVLIQSIARMYIAQVHYFPLAYRYRLFTRKVRKAVAPAKASLDNSDAFYPEDFATTRRQSFLFLTLKIAGAQDLDRFELAATVIQSHIRRILALVVYREQLHARKEVLATRLQKWVVKRLWKRKFSRAMKQIRPFLKGIVESKRKKHDAAVKMQSLMRGFVKRKWLKYLLSTRKRCSAQIGRWLFYRFKVWKIHQAIYIRRLQSDLYQGGLSMYERTRTYWYSHFLWLGIKKTKQIEKLDHELQRIFSSMSLSNGVEIPKVFKLLRDCKGLISGAFTATTIELQFTKMKVGIERRVEYPRFLDFLANLAVVRFLDFDPPKTIFEDIAAFKQQPAPPNPAAVAATMAGNIAQTSLAKGAPPPPVDDKMMAVMGYQFGSLRGRPALIAHFVHQYIGTLPEYERAMEYLGKKSARELAEAVIAQAIATIQGFVRNRAFIRQTIDDMRRRKQAKIDHKIYVAAARIQSVVKGFLGRRLITRMAQTLYSKYVDGETEREYWFNPRTNNSFWVKPKLLGKYDCGTAIRMPKEDELFSVMCSNCEVVHGTCFCETCDHPYCTPCFATLHRTGTRKTHLHILIDNCVQCEFQIGTRYCNTCKDLFCDSCYQYMHRAGRLRFHAFERFAAPCDVCNKRTARWKEHGHVTLNSSEVSVRSKIHRQGTSSLSSAASSKNTSIQSMYNSRYKIKLWCTVCYKVEHEGEAPVERKADAQTHTLALEKIYYYGRAVKKHIENKEIEKAQALIEKSFQARKAVVEMKLRTKAALNIQRVYRGYQGRKKIHAFIQERKELMAKRHIEDAIRQSVLYKLKSFFGFSIMLETDTPLERVKKMYPWYMHHIVAACIENNWTDACRLLTEHEKHLAKTSATKKATWMDYVKAEIAVYYARKRYDKALRQFEERSALVDTAASTFYNVRELRIR